VIQTVLTRAISEHPGFLRTQYEAKLNEQLARISSDSRALDLEVRSCAADPMYFLSRHFMHEELPPASSPERTGRIVRLVPNSIQLALVRGAAATNVVLKARKPGVSTLIDGLFLHEAIFRPNVRCVIVSHDKKHTSGFIDRLKFAIAQLPDWIRPALRYASRSELEFRDNGSKISALTSGNVRIGRGSDIDRLHLSEGAFYNDLHSILTGAGEAMRPGGVVWWESTPNGINEFRELYVDARDGRSRAKAHFFPWFTNLNNALALPSDDFESSLSKEEREFMHAHSLTLMQMAWRRDKMRTLKETFIQEHPEDDETCFISSGTPKFDVRHWRSLLAAIETDVTPIPFGELGEAFDGLDDGNLTVWEAPIEGERYVVGGDVSEGLPKGDYSHLGVLKVTDLGRREQVAEWHGLVAPGDFGIRAAAVANVYNRALLGIERNNHGHAALFAAQRVAGYYPMYRHREFDQRGRSAQGKLGFPTTTGTRLSLLDNLERHVKGGEHIVRSAKLCREAMSFQAGDEDLRDDHPRRSVVHDDTVFGWGIADWIAVKGGAIPVA